jgi:hypothetical protein
VAPFSGAFFRKLKEVDGTFFPAPFSGSTEVDGTFLRVKA